MGETLRLSSAGPLGSDKTINQLIAAHVHWGSGLDLMSPAGLIHSPAPLQIDQVLVIGNLEPDQQHQGFGFTLLSGSGEERSIFHYFAWASCGRAAVTSS